MSNSNHSGEYEQLFDVLMAFYNERDYYDLLNAILEKMMGITHADGGTLYVVEEDRLNFKIMRNISQNIQLTAKDKINVPAIPLDGDNIVNISAFSVLKNEIISIDDVYNNAEFNFEGPKKYDKENNYHTQSMLVLPLVATGSTDPSHQVIGLIQLINSINPETGSIQPFGDIYNPPLLPALSNISANALANILYIQEIQALLNSFVRVMTAAIDERTPYNVNHTNNVAKYCNAFALFLGSHLPPEHPLYFNSHRREELVMAAYLHDIGKLVTPLEVMDKSDRLGPELPILRLRLQIKREQLENQYLKGGLKDDEYARQRDLLKKAGELVTHCNTAPVLDEATIHQVKRLSALTYLDENGVAKPLFSTLHISSLSIPRGTLTAQERKIMQDHVSVTERLLEQMTFVRYYKDVPFWASHHHEFSDGSGYPYGMSGSKIPPEVSILTMMDVFDALTAIDRPYKKAKSAKEALSTLQEMAANGKFPAEIVDLFAQSNVWGINLIHA